MAREFSSKEAKELILKHKNLLTQANVSFSQFDKIESKIKSAATILVEQEILSVLKDVPIEELNKDGQKIRLKPLKSCGINTLADVIAQSKNNLSAIKGISEASANMIRYLSKQIADETRGQIKIKLSLDNKNVYSTNLIREISVYKQSFPYLTELKTIIGKNSSKINRAIEKLNPATGGAKWLFASKSKKEEAVSAYNELLELISGDYFKTVSQLGAKLNYVSKLTADLAWKDFKDNNVEFFTILEKVIPGLLGSDNSVYGLTEELAKEVEGQSFLTDGLKCSLRRYQEWGVKYILLQKRVLLGDEMGLGKTVQAIATMVSLRNAGNSKFLVVCPASVIINWCREIEKHSDLKVIKIHGKDRKEAIEEWTEKGGVGVTTFETTEHFNLEEQFKFSLLIVDEAHYIKNPNAARTINTTAISTHADRMLFMTGTALENNVEEMISLVEILQPEVAKSIKKIAFMSSAPQFREKIASVYYRRKRSDVLTELPDLTESREWCSMNKEEEKLYEKAIIDKHYADARRVSWSVEDLENSTKAQRLKEIAENAEAEGRKIVVFSFFLDTIDKISKYFGDKCMQPINGSIPPERRQEIIDEFEKAEDGSILLAQIQSGGTGLNIQSASVVVICEPQFKPSIENQAIARSYRMGQARNVLVYRLLCEDTVDERLTEVLENKQAIFDAFADKSVSAEKDAEKEFEIDEKTFGSIMKEETERINKKYQDQ